MIFSSNIFIFAFLPIVVMVNYALQDKYRNLWLLACSIFFYGWNDAEGLGVLLRVIVISYLCAILIAYMKGKTWKKLLLVVGVLLALRELLFYKYINFLLENIALIAGENQLGLLDIVIPLGISFFTFKSISYMADVYEGRYEAERNPLHVATYIALFPQIMSGPIDTFDALRNDLHSKSISVDDMSCGIERFIIGLAKKVLIADSLGRMVDMVWQQGAGANTIAVAWLGSIAYSLQLLYDFGGYSDMAIGVGRMLGFHFSENFDYPYISKSITEFWRRWHITLGTWFKNYVYIPCGGNRRHVYVNLLLVFLLTGFWHGAEWSFILWGGIYGVLRCIERLCLPKQEKNSNVVGKVVGHFYTLFAVNLLWVLFRAPSIEAAIAYFKAMVGIMSESPSGVLLGWYLTRWNVFVLALAVIFCMPLIPKLELQLKSKLSEVKFLLLKEITLLVLFMAAILRVVTETYTTFIYFQF